MKVWNYIAAPRFAAIALIAAGVLRASIMQHGFTAVVAVSAVLLSAGCTNGGKEKPQKIELKSIYSTTQQEGLKKPADTKAFEHLMYKVKGWNGASNLFLVRGGTIDQAIQATLRVVVDGVSGNEMYLEDGQKGQLWLVVYWGVAGSGSKWTIDSATRSENTVRVYYRTGRTALADMHRYYAWIPLGEARAGKYLLELWDQESEEKVLARSFSIIPRK